MDLLSSCSKNPRVCEIKFGIFEKQEEYLEEIDEKLCLFETGCKRTYAKYTYPFETVGCLFLVVFQDQVPRFHPIY